MKWKFLSKQRGGGDSDIFRRGAAEISNQMYETAGGREKEKTIPEKGKEEKGKEEKGRIARFLTAERGKKKR